MYLGIPQANQFLILTISIETEIDNYLKKGKGMLLII